MSDPPGLDDLLRSLRRVHRGVLATLAVCALVVVSVADPADDGGLQASDPRFTAAALALGVGSVVARRQAAAPRSDGPARVVFALLGMLLAGAIGLLAVALAWLQDEREAALLYVLGAVILALRAPAAPGPGGRAA